jgi:hypothetical protein
MKTPQVKPEWKTGIYIGNGVVATPKEMEREDMLRELWEREEYHLFTDLIMIARKDFYSRHDTMTDDEITLKYQQVIGGF